MQNKTTKLGLYESGEQVFEGDHVLYRGIEFKIEEWYYLNDDKVQNFVCIRDENCIGGAVPIKLLSLLKRQE